MKRTSQRIVLAACTALSSGGAVAGGLDQNTAAPDHSTPINGPSSTGSLPKHSWERGELLNLTRDQQFEAADYDAESTAPRVNINFDASGTQPGLPKDLGNTHAGSQHHDEVPGTGARQHPGAVVT